MDRPKITKEMVLEAAKEIGDLNALPVSGPAYASAAAANTPQLETLDGGAEWPKP